MDAVATVSAAVVGIMPIRASTRASAISKSSIAWRTDLSENKSARASVVARLSMSGTDIGSPGIKDGHEKTSAMIVHGEPLYIKEDRFIGARQPNIEMPIFRS